MPKRIQLSRKKGWRKPEGAVVVSRPSMWGNPYTVQGATEAGYKDGHAMAVWAFEEWLRGNHDFSKDRHRRDWVMTNIHDLEGKDLACWCPLDKPCHADVLLRLANQ